MVPTDGLLSGLLFLPITNGRFQHLHFTGGYCLYMSQQYNTICNIYITACLLYRCDDLKISFFCYSEEMGLLENWATFFFDDQWIKESSLE